MKATAGCSKEFQPVTLTLVLETQEEVNALCQVGNYSELVAEAIHKDSKTVPRQAIIGVLCNGFYDTLTPYCDKR